MTGLHGNVWHSGLTSGSGTMDGWATFEFSLGLRHVLEDSLALLAGESVQANRKLIVLKDASDFMERAKRGSEATASQAFVANASHASAVEAYALVFRHLRTAFGEDLAPKIMTTAKVLSSLSKDETVEEDDREAAEQLIGSLLSSLKHEKSLANYASLETSEAW